MNNRRFSVLVLLGIEPSSGLLVDTFESFLKSRGWERLDAFQVAWTKFLDANTSKLAKLEVLSEISELNSRIENCSISYAIQIGRGKVWVGNI